jgi:thiol-activated cytolysin
MKHVYVIVAILLSSMALNVQSDAALMKKIKSKITGKENKKKKKPANAAAAPLISQLETLKDPEGIDSDIKPEKLTETPLASQKEESRVQGKSIDGSPVTYVTTTQKFKASAAFDQQILLNPSSDVVYPGSVLLGHTIASGTYQEVTKGVKAPLTISYDLTNIKGGDGKTGKVTGKIVPSLSKYRDLHNQIMGQKLGKASTTYSFEATEVYSESDFGVKFNFGVGFNSGVVETSIKSGFDFGKGSKKNKYMVKFMETFYTVDVDQGNDTFLYQSFNVADFKGYRPVYISSIAYGRLAYLTIESDETWDSIKSNLEVAVDASLYGKYEGGFSTAVNNLNKNSKINITVIGGSSVAVSLESFMEMLKTGGFSSDNTGKIVAYKLRFVDDNSVANTVYNDEYTVTKIVEQRGKGIETVFTLYKIKLNANDGNGKDMELYGNLEISDGVTSKSFWSLPRSANKKISGAWRVLRKRRCEIYSAQ